MKIFNTWKLLSFLLAIFLITSCTKDKDDDNNPPGPKGNLKVKFDHRFGKDPFSLNQAYTTDEDEQLTFTNIKYYISNIRLKRADGSWWSEEESYYIVDISVANPFILEVEDIPSGTYTEISYMIGVDSARNVSGSQTGALSPSEGMFWSWNTGYVFIKVEGTSPQAETGDFSFHVGGFSGANNALHTNTHSMGAHLLSILPDAVPQIHLVVDIREVFDGHHNVIKVSEMNRIHMPGPQAVMFAENFHEVFSLDHIHD